MSCSECFRGHSHTREPTGVISEIHGRQTYVATPPADVQSRGIIIIIVPDAFGWEFANNRLLADQYASRGNFTVYLPEFMENGGQDKIDTRGEDTMAQLTFTESSWGWKLWSAIQLAYGVDPFFIYNSFGRSWPRIRAFFEAIRSHEGFDRAIGAAGFCWGGRPVMSLAHPESVAVNGKPLVDAVFTGHPSALSLPDDAGKVIRPVSIAIGDKDLVTPVSHVDDIKKTRQTLKNVTTEIVVYAGAGHGFCVRVGPHNKNQIQQSKEAEEQALRWFNKHLR
ncbi:dienelactone hydrolase family protein [Seiridium cupressi]